MKHADGYGALLFFLVTLYLNHRSLKSCYRVTSRLAQGITHLTISPSGPLVHHLILILCNIGLEVIEYGETFLLTGNNNITSLLKKDTNYLCITGYPGYPSAEPASLHTLRVLRLLVCSLGSTYFFVIVAVPELIIGRLVESMTAILVSIREDVSKGRISAADFCRKADIVRNSYSELGKVTTKEF